MKRRDGGWRRRFAIPQGWAQFSPANLDDREIIPLKPGKRGGKPCVRGLRITVGDVLGWIAAGMSWAEIKDDCPGPTDEGIRACLASAADREHRSLIALGPHAIAV